MTASREVEGRIAGRYRLEHELGRGAMGAVYRVHDERTGRALALKQLHVSDAVPPQSAGAAPLPDENQRAALTALFEREFYTLSELAHPLIIEVYDYGHAEHGAYYTMELLDGEDLDARGQLLDVREACSLLRDVSSSLAIVHSRRLVHRDVSPRNVRCTASGRAKLIDFGAMVPMGVARHVVGTPPFVAPEAMQQQQLDGRSDLFSLGALAYFMLTGQHAYPARTMTGLRDAWRNPPPPPQRLVPELPRALSELVMELLQLDPNARPASAAVVIERLCAIAGLPTEERLEVTRAYLVTPRLVGRDGALVRVRECLALLEHGRGCSVLLQGRSGSGRSRLLDACVLEAKLAGATVLRADAGDAGAGDYGVVRALSLQLNPPPRLAYDHGPLVEQLLALARDAPLAIAVDDLERIDEPSLRVLAGLAHRADGSQLALLCTAEPEFAGEVAALLRARSETITVEPLHAFESEALVRSLFGNTAHVVTAAGRIHELSQGFPREAMKLAQHLVERGVARHDAGGWLLPSELEPGDLPASLTDAMRAKLHALSAPARELAELFALSEPGRFSLDEYSALLASSDRGRTFRALDELVRGSVLTPLGNRHRFSSSGWAPLIAQDLSPERRVELHARHAAAMGVVSEAQNPRLRAYHLLESGQAEQAIALLLERRDDKRFELSPATLDLVTRALERATQIGLPARARIELQAWLVSIASVVGDRASFERYAPGLLARLVQDSGLADYDALDPALPDEERLRRALLQLQARYDATPESERGLPPVTSMQRLGRACVDHGSLAGVVSDLAVIDRAPRLDPLLPLAAPLRTVQAMTDGMRCFQQGRFGRARELLLQTLSRIEQPDHQVLPATYQQSLRLGLLYLIGLIEAAFGVPTAPERLAALEVEPGYRVNGLRVHMSFALNQGDIGQAREFERRADLMQLEDGPEQCFPLTSARLELAAYVLADDLMGVKQCVERLQDAVARFGGGSVFVDLARAQYRRLQGDHAGALRALQPALSIAPLDHQAWVWIARTHVQVMMGLERVAEAADLGVAYRQVALREDITPGDRLIAVPAIEALALAGRCDEAVALADDLIAEVEAERIRGLHRGAVYEARARAAAAAGDPDAFRRFAELCSIEYRIGRNPALVAKYERLMQFGARHGLAAADGAARDGSSASESKLATMSTLTTADDADTRAAE